MRSLRVTLRFEKALYKTKDYHADNEKRIDLRLFIGHLVKRRLSLQTQLLNWSVVVTK